MPEYLVLRRQKGGGCDYTLKTKEFDTLEQAVEYAKKYCLPDDPRQFDSVEDFDRREEVIEWCGVVEASNVALINAYAERAAMRKEIVARLQAETDAKDKKKLAELKAKYEK